MTMRSCKSALTRSLIFCCSILAYPAAATDIYWSGFLSAVAGKTLEEGTYYNTGFMGYDGLYDHRLKFNPESILGLQALVPINDKMRATVQMVGRGGEEFDADLDWAFLTYQFNDEFAFKAGRFRIPFYYYSDFLEVGKAYYWIRPPAKVYNGPSRLNGVNLSYAKSFERFDIRSQIWWGTGKTSTTTQLLFDLYNNNGLTFSIGQNSWTIRAVYSQTDADVFAETDFPLDETTVVPAGSFVTNTHITFAGLAAIVDWNNWLWRAEYVDARSDQGDEPIVWYASAGYVFGDFTPHITYTDSDENTAVEHVGSTEIAAGIAWDLDAKSVLKFEYIKETPDNQGLRPSELISFGIDVLF